MYVCQNGNYHSFPTNTLSPFGVNEGNDHTALVSGVSSSLNSLPGPSKRSVFHFPMFQEINMYSAVTDITKFALDFFIYLFFPSSIIRDSLHSFHSSNEETKQFDLVRKGQSHK